MTGSCDAGLTRRRRQRVARSRAARQSTPLDSAIQPPAAAGASGGRGGSGGRRDVRNRRMKNHDDKAPREGIAALSSHYNSHVRRNSAVPVFPTRRDACSTRSLQTERVVPDATGRAIVFSNRRRGNDAPPPPRSRRAPPPLGRHAGSRGFGEEISIACAARMFKHGAQRRCRAFRRAGRSSARNAA